MGFLDDIFNGGKKAEQAQIDRPFNSGQVIDQYNQANSLLTQQGNFVNALAAQNGIQNQNQLVRQLQQQAAGQGPNPALAQLNLATAANTANQAALMAGQRGSAANPALIARLAAQQGAANQQNAIGQSAALQAQQQLNAQNQLANITGQQVQNQGQAILNQNQLGQNILNTVSGGIANQNNAALQNAQMANQVNIANAHRNAGIAGGLLNAAGPALGLAFGGPAGAAAVNTLQSGGPTGQNMGMGLANGGMVPGKAPMAGDHPANDVVDAKLSPGEVVIPKSIMESKDPAAAAAAFVQGVMHSAAAGKKKVEDKQAYADGGIVAPAALANNVSEAITPSIDTLKNLGANIQNALVGDTGSSVLSALNPGLGLVANVSSPIQSSIAPDTKLGGPSIDTTPKPNMAVPPIDVTGSMKNALGQITQGIQGEAAAQGQLGKQQADVYKQQADQSQQLLQHYNNSVAQLDSQRQQLQKDIQDQKIDPSRYLNSMGTGGKVTTAIGLLLSGIGSGLTGQANMAQDFLQKSIDRDIDAQKAELGKKENLLSRNLQQYGNLRDAITVTKVMQNDIYQSKIAQLAAQSNDPIVQARAQKAIGEMNLQIQPQIQQTAQRQAIFQAARQGQVGAGTAIRFLVPENEQKDAYKQLDDANQQMKTIQNVKDAFGKIANLETVKQRAGRPIASKQEIEGLRTGILAEAKQIFGGLSDNEIKLLENNIPGLTDDKKSMQNKLDTVEKLLSSKMNYSILDTYGIPYSKPTASKDEATPMQRLKARQGK